MSRTEPRPDIDGMPDHRAAVPDEHRALRLLRRISVALWVEDDWGFPYLMTTDNIPLSPDEADLIRRLKENP